MALSAALYAAAVFAVIIWRTAGMPLIGDAHHIYARKDLLPPPEGKIHTTVLGEIPKLIRVGDSREMYLTLLIPSKDERHERRIEDGMTITASVRAAGITVVPESVQRTITSNDDSYTFQWVVYGDRMGSHVLLIQFDPPILPLVELSEGTSLPLEMINQRIDRSLSSVVTVVNQLGLTNAQTYIATLGSTAIGAVLAVFGLPMFNYAMRRFSKRKKKDETGG